VFLDASPHAPINRNRVFIERCVNVGKKDARQVFSSELYAEGKGLQHAFRFRSESKIKRLMVIEKRQLPVDAIAGVS
jgi:hypothetical protein